MRTELNSHSSSNVSVNKTPALVGCCRCLPAWLCSICKCSLAKKSLEKTPAVSGGCCLIAQSVQRDACSIELDALRRLVCLFSKCFKHRKAVI